MLTLTWPWMLALVPLPWLYRWVRKPVAQRGAALLVPGYADVTEDSSSASGDIRHWLCWILLTLLWLALVVAGCRPQWVGEPVALPTSGRDLLLAVDISGSMEEADMQVGNDLIDRLTVVKTVVGDFVDRRSGDRLGLILFGSNAYLQAPLTFDRKTINTLLQEALIGFAGKATAIGDAIGLGVKRLKDRPENARVIILLTDGANTSGEVEPLKAAQLAKAYHVKIYTIGMGADEVLRRTLFGTRRVNPSVDLDEKTLTNIAELTGGEYFRARSPEDLARIYARLDELEPIAQDKETFRPTKALFHWPLGVAFITSFVLAVIKRNGANDA
jgi:Ca-activated chloride channel homolog